MFSVATPDVLLWILLFAIPLAILFGIGKLPGRPSAATGKTILLAAACAVIGVVFCACANTSTVSNTPPADESAAVESRTDLEPSSFEETAPDTEMSQPETESTDPATDPSLPDEEAARTEESESTEKTVVCIGDSITSGGVLYYDEPDGWPVYLQEKLYGLNDNWTVVNLGVSDTTLLDEGRVPYRSTGNIERAKEIAPDVAIIMLGTNDSWDDNWSADAFRAELQALVEELRAARPDMRIVLMAPPAVYCEPYPTESNPFSMDDALIAGDIRSIIRDTASAMGTGYVDLHQLTENHPEWFPDTVHPDGDGARAIADYVFGTVFDYYA